MSSDPEPQTWACTAYGPDLPTACFFERADTRCRDLAQCSERMHTERQRVFRRIQELAAHGDPVMADLADNFTHPDTLLNAEPTEPND